MELSEQKAKDMDDILRFAVKHGLLESFDVSYYQSSVKPELEKSYVSHLAGLIHSYMVKYNRKWVGLDGRVFTCNHNTKAFLESGGFQKIYETEKRQEEKETIDLKLAEKALSDYPTTKWIARLGFIIALGLAILELVKFLKEKY